MVDLGTGRETNIIIINCHLFILSQKNKYFHIILQEALSKAAGKKNKTPVQLDLGDMLAALEKQQQAMKARQITNTRPLSYTGDVFI